MEVKENTGVKDNLFWLFIYYLHLLLYVIIYYYYL